MRLRINHLLALALPLPGVSFATMIVGAIGNDGSGGYDGSFNVTASYQGFSQRPAILAFDGSGISTIAGEDGDQEDEYEALAGSTPFGQNYNWILGNPTPSTTRGCSILQARMAHASIAA